MTPSDYIRLLAALNDPASRTIWPGRDWFYPCNPPPETGDDVALREDGELSPHARLLCWLIAAEALLDQPLVEEIHTALDALCDVVRRWLRGDATMREWWAARTDAEDAVAANLRFSGPEGVFGSRAAVVVGHLFITASWLPDEIRLWWDRVRCRLPLDGLRTLAIDSINVEDLIDSLERRLSDREAGAICAALQTVPDERAIEPLMRRLAAHGGPDAAELRTLHAFIRAGITATTPATVRSLELALDSERFDNRARAVAASLLGEARALPHLMEQLRGGDPQRRTMAIAPLAIAFRGRKATIAAVLDALADREWPVRYSAVQVLRHMRRAGREAVVRLQELAAHDGHPVVRKAAADALRRMR